ncbi:Nicotinate phosphoribosyltransferase [Trichoplax sp. H2]|nr:Nicotinate phosphoribosyltransferase [Trichoplax sp. H2]|eukprot:RDD39322.1 Nicotinate phosphoribosyltransferase [Trichoplax sp. H2]
MATKMVHQGIVQPLLTDLYQITMAYAYWKFNKQSQAAVFELFFRNNPFKGGYTIFAGLSDCIEFVSNFAYSKSDIDYVKSILPSSVEEEFFHFLSGIHGDQVTIAAVPEGSVVFPRVPLLRVEGPLANSLVTTNATRFRLTAGNDKPLFEFGLRRAQGPNGGLSASRYCYIGGFNGTSNVLAGKLFSIPVVGTHSHAFVMSFSGLTDLCKTHVQYATGSDSKLFDLKCGTQKWLTQISPMLDVAEDEIIEGELAAFISIAIAFPTNFLALVDTYDVIRSGIPCFCAVTLALDEAGYRAKGIRLDSGDLAYLSRQSRCQFQLLAERLNKPWLSLLTIVASNDINVRTMNSLNQQGHQINAYGIGTHLVTCQEQPALGCVYKLVELDGVAKMKLTQERSKLSLPAKKKVYRLFGENGSPLADLLQKYDESPPLVDQQVLCCHPFQESERKYIVPSRVEEMNCNYWIKGKSCKEIPKLVDIRNYCQNQVNSLRRDHQLLSNLNTYKVFVSDALYQTMHKLWVGDTTMREPGSYHE